LALLATTIWGGSTPSGDDVRQIQQPDEALGSLGQIGPVVILRPRLDADEEEEKHRDDSSHTVPIGSAIVERLGAAPGDTLPVV
jgi:hypothetical protein